MATNRTASRGSIGRPAAVAVAAVLAMVAAGCSSASDDAPDGDDPTTTASAVSTDAEPGEDEADETEQAEPEEPTIVLGEDLTAIYEQDFEDPVSTEWSERRTADVSDGEVLGPFGQNQVAVQLVDLPDHDVVSVSFDLLILGQWITDGSNQNRWQMEVDSTRVINTTFANEGPQAYPADLPTDPSPAGTDAVERARFGITPAGDDPVIEDSRYRVERQFLHSADQLTILMEAKRLGAPDNQAWAIDNFTVSAASRPDREQVTDLVFTVVDQQMSVSGTVPTAEDLAYMQRVLDVRVTSEIDFSGVSVGDGGLRPLWFHDVGALEPILAPSDNFRLAVGEEEIAASGTVRTARWGVYYAERLGAVFGDGPLTGLDVDVIFGEDVVNRLTEFDLLFETGSAELDSVALATLDELAAYLADNEDIVLQINGHTDSTGENDTNRNLSLGRAEGALRYLAAAGVDPARLGTTARGANDLRVDPELTDEDRAANRRASFLIPQG